MRQDVFEAPIVGLLFWAFSLGPPLAKSQKMADLGVLAKFVITWLYGHLWSRSLQKNVVLCLHFKCILIRRWCHLRQGVFEAPIVGLLFWAFSLGPRLAKSQKRADLSNLAKFVITRLYGHLWSRSLQQNVVLCLHFKWILIRRWCHLRQGVFEASIVGLLFWAFSLVPPLAKSQKMADLGVLAKFVITRLYGHLWSRSLQQNVVLSLHFKCILIRRWCHLCQDVFEAPIVGLLFWAFSLGPPLAKSQKMADLGVLAKFVITRLYGHLWSRSLQQNVVLCLHVKCILIKMMPFAPGCFWSPYSRPTFLSIFPWSPLGKISENGRFRCPCQICHNAAIRTLMEPKFAVKCCPMFALQVHTNKEMMPFAPGCFWSPYSRPTFLSIFPWSPLGKISENGRFRCPCQICHNAALRTLMEPQFAEKCCPMFALQVHTN